METFQDRIGYRFRRPEILRTALSHASYASEETAKGRRVPSSERLEFLGDAVLELVIREELFRQRPVDDVGRLTVARAWLAGERNLAEAASRVRVEEALQVGQSHRNREATASMKADAVEAIIGAMYLDGGLECAADFVRAWVFQEGGFGRAPETYYAKNRLQELCMKQGKGLPEYSCASSSTRSGRSFRCVVKVGEDSAIGDGSSKGEAEEQAAFRLLMVMDPPQGSVDPAPPGRWSL